MATLEILGVLLVSFGSNIPLGRVRARCRKFSVAWFVAVHASIPLIVALRLLLGIRWAWAPVFITVAVLGQLVGGRRSGSESPSGSHAGS